MHRCALLAIAAAIGESLPPFDQTILKHVQPVIDNLTSFHNVSFSVGIRHHRGRITVLAGLDDHSPGSLTKMTNASRFPMGSVTKSWTATAIMRLRDAGKIDIDAPISHYVNPILMRLNGTSMEKLWNPKNDSMQALLVKNMTTRLVMGMRAGLRDYNDSFFHSFVSANKGTGRYWTPFDILYQLNKTFVCPPGRCGHYASPGYELLGLELAAKVVR